MTISGFTMVKNADKLYYPIKEAIESILPIVDEFVVALGDCDPDDKTQELIESINSNKVRIIHTVWDIQKYPRGMENAHQTDIAMKACNGDWLFYLQADEVVHEDDHAAIVKACQDNLDNSKVEGLLFNYLHFFGDYNHYNDHHGWYPHEIRIVRNLPDVHSYISAQSFRKIPNFDGVSYRQIEGTERLTVKRIDARIFHYGWVRPPRLMQKKSKSLDTIHKGTATADAQYAQKSDNFDYGNMTWYKAFKGTHPAVMESMISKFDWKEELHFEKKYTAERALMKHEKPRGRFLTFLEQNLFGGKQLFGYSNWKLTR